MGIFANLPIALAPGMGLNVRRVVGGWWKYFSYTLFPYLLCHTGILCLHRRRLSRCVFAVVLICCGIDLLWY